MRQIWAECLIVSVAGGLIGTLVGLAGGFGLAQGRGLDFAFNPMDIVLGPLLLVLLGSLAGLLPARAATQLDPAQALRPSS